MNRKRPCLTMAVVFVLGEGIASRELGLLIKILLAGSVLAWLCAWQLVAAAARLYGVRERGAGAAGAETAGAGRGLPDANAYRRFSCGKKKNAGRGTAVLLLVLFFLAGAGRYAYEARRFDIYESAAARFGELRVKLSGRAERCEYGDGQTRVTVGEGVLSSAYGSAETLPPGASAQLRALQCGGGAHFGLSGRGSGGFAGAAGALRGNADAGEPAGQRGCF